MPSFSISGSDPLDRFQPQEGIITLYTSTLSPCARRVRIALEEKGLPYHAIEIDLNNRENHQAGYLKINPQGKVPAIALRNFRDLPNCTLYESNALTEWLDEQFPNEGPQLYPTDPTQRAQAKQWQRWEMAMAEDFWRVTYANLRGFILRCQYSPLAYANLMEQRYPERPDLKSKLGKTYEGTLLSADETKRRMKSLYAWLEQLESHLALCPPDANGQRYMLGDRLSIADVSVIPRTMMYPLLSMLTSSYERQEAFPLVDAYTQGLSERGSFSGSGQLGPLAQKVASWLPWWLIQSFGNWRSGLNLTHFTGLPLLREHQAELAEQAPFDRSACLALEAAVDGVTLYLASDGPNARTMQLALRVLDAPIAKQIAVDSPHQENHSQAYREMVNQFGDVPCLRINDLEISGVQAMIEYLDRSINGSKMQLLPDDSIQRCQVRMIHGAVQTCLNYSLGPLRELLVHQPRLHEEFPSSEVLRQALHNRPERIEPDAIEACVALYSKNYQESDLAAYRSGIMAHLEALERLLNQSVFVVGERLSSADLAEFSLIESLLDVGIRVEESVFPCLFRWWNKIESLI